MGQFDPSKAVSCVLEPNHASLHDGRTIHGSNANTSSLRRCGYPAVDNQIECVACDEQFFSSQ